MTHLSKRCAHCHVTYAYQRSGHGCDAPTNDDTYCPSCMSAINDALQAVPVRFKRDWVVTRDVSVETLVELKRAGMQKSQAKGLLFIHQAPMSLYDLVDPTNHNHRGVVRLDGKTYQYDYWSKDGMAAGQVCIEVSRETSTGKVVGPWSFADDWSSWPTLLDDEVGVYPTRDPNVGVVEAFPLRNLAMGITEIWGQNSLADLQSTIDEDPP